MKIPPLSSSFLAFSVIIAIDLLTSAQAANVSWSAGGGAGNTTWASGANWSGGVPATTDTAVFNISGVNGDENVTLSAAQTIGGLVFNNTGSTSIITNGTNRVITTGSAGLTINSGAGVVSFGATTGGAQISFILGADQTWTNNSSNVLSGNTSNTINNAGFTLTITGSGGILPGAVISGSGGIIKNGTGTLTLSKNNSFSGGVTLNSGTVSFFGSNNVFGSGTLTINGGVINHANGTALTIANAVKVNSDFSFTGSSNANFSGAMDLSGSTRQITSGGLTMEISGTIANGGLTYVGNNANALTLSGSNTYSLGTTITSGTIVAANNSALGSGSVTQNGGTLVVGGSAAVSLTVGALSGASTALITGGTAGSSTLTTSFSSGTSTYAGNMADGSGGAFNFTKSGSGVMVLSGTNTYTGVTTVSGGVLSISSTSALPGWDTTGKYSVASGASLAVGNAVTDSNITTMLGTTNFAVGSAIGFDTSSGNRTYSTTLANTGLGALGLTKIGSNTLVLSATNTYTGVTSINAGAISVASIASNLGGTGTINIGLGTTGGTLVYTGTGAETIARAINLAGTTGGATLTNNSGTSAGALTFSGNFGSTGAGVKTLTLNGSSAAQNIISGTISNFDGTNTTAVQISGGDWTLSGSNTFSGGVILSGGKMRVGNSNALGTGTVTLSGGNWLVGSSATSTVANNISITANSTGNMGSNTLELTGNITGSSNWAVNGFSAGKMKFSGDNSGWTGNYTISGQNTLQLNNVHALGSGTTFTFGDVSGGLGVLESLVGVNLNQNFVLGSSGTSTSSATFKTTADMTISGTISSIGAVGLIKTGAGTLTLGSTSSKVTQTYTGATTVSAGTLIINGTVGNGGITVASGATLGGSITAGGTTTIQAGGILAVGNSPGLGTFSTLNLSGTTEIQFNAGATPAGRGTSFDAIDVTTLAYGGTLKLIFAGALTNNQTFDIFNLLGTTSGSFATVTLSGSSTSTNLTLASGTWSGNLDLGYGGGLQTFQFSQLTGDLSVIPEPQTWALVGLGLGFTLLRLRSRNHRRG